jgi:hypothetical protein
VVCGKWYGGTAAVLPIVESNERNCHRNAEKLAFHPVGNLRQKLSLKANLFLSQAMLLS